MNTTVTIDGTEFELGTEIAKTGGRKKGQDNFVVIGYKSDVDKKAKTNAIVSKKFYSDVVNPLAMTPAETKKVTYRAYRIAQVDNVEKDGWKDVTAHSVFPLKPAAAK